MPDESEWKDGLSSKVATWLCVSAVVVHLLSGLWLSPEWLFSKYPDAIRLLREGRLGAEASADYSPLYFLLNRLFPPEGLRGIQAIIGAFAVWGTSRIAFHLSGEPAAVVSAWLVALCAPVLAYEATLEPDLPIATLEIGALWALSLPGTSRRQLLWAGIALGLATALRPSGLLLLGMAAAALLVSRGGTWPERLRSGALLFLVGGGVAAAGILGLRASYGGETRATMSVGAVLHMGNRPEGTGFGAHPPHFIKLVEAQERSFTKPDLAHELYRQVARHAEARHDLGQGKTEDYWVGKTLAFLIEEPVAYLSLQGRKLQAYLVGPFAHDISIVRDLTDRAARTLAPVPVQLLAILGITGLLWMVLRPGRPRVLMLLTFFASHVALSIIFYVVARYQLPVLALLAVSSGVWVGEAARVIWERRPGWSVPALVSTLAIALLTSSVEAASRRSRMLSRGQDGGVAVKAFQEARASGDGAAATQAFIEAQAAQPFLRQLSDFRGVDLADSELLRQSVAISIDRYGLETPIDSLLTAQLLVLAGDCAHAMPLLDELGTTSIAWAVYDRLLDPDLLAATCLREEERATEAIERIERALTRRPGALDPLAQRYAAAVAQGDEAVAEELRERLLRLHDPFNGDFVAAEALLAWSQPLAALEASDRILAAFPAAAVVHHQRALALAAMRRTPEAMEALDRATLLSPAHPFNVAPLENTVRRALSEAPFDPATLSIAGEYALRRGRWREARQHLDHASSLFGHAPSREHQLRVRLMRSLSQGE